MYMEALCTWGGLSDLKPSQTANFPIISYLLVFVLAKNRELGPVTRIDG